MRFPSALKHMSPLQGFYITGALPMGLHPWLQPVTPFGVKVSAIRLPPTAMGGGTFVANQASGPVASSTTTHNLSLSYQPTTAPVATLESSPKSSAEAGHFHLAYNEPVLHQVLLEFSDHRGGQLDPQRKCTPSFESDLVVCPSASS